MLGIKKHIKLCVILILVFLSSMFCLEKEIFAAEPEHLGRIVDGSLLTTQLEVEDIQTPLLRGSLLNKGTAKCINAGDGQVTASGATVAHVVCQKLYINLSVRSI